MAGDPGGRPPFQAIPAPPTRRTNACVTADPSAFERAGRWGGGGAATYIRLRNTREARGDPATKGRGAALIMTLPLEDNLHYITGGGGGPRSRWRKAAVDTDECISLCCCCSRALRWKDRWLPASAFPPPLKTACGVHAGSSNTAFLPRPAPLRGALVTATQKHRDEKTLHLKVQCPIFDLIYEMQ